MLTKSQFDALIRSVSQAEKAGLEIPVEELEQIVLQHEAETMSASLHAFIVGGAWEIVEPDQEFKDGWHIQAICEHLEAIVRGDVPNLLMNVPPGHMKSLCTCVFMPAWAWTTNPSLRFLFATYDQALSTRDSMRCRQIIQSQWYQERWGQTFSLVGDQNEKTKFENDQRGWRIATSVGGRGTGEHPDIIGVDDPHKVKEAESEVERDKAIRWWDGTISTRGKIRGVRRVVIMQRLDQRDLSAHILEKNAGDWDHICLPERYELGRMSDTRLGWNDPREEEGELLWPEAFPELVVASLERELGGLRAAGQLQQRPAPLGGQMFRRDWFSIVEARPLDARRVRYFDKAGTDEAGAYTAGVLLSVDEHNFYVEDVVRAQLSPFKRNRLIKTTAQLDSQRYDNTVTTVVEQEPGSSGKFDAINTVKELAGMPVAIDRVTGSKESRAAPFAAQCEVGNVVLVRGDWNEAFLDELESFPNGRYKDQVDAVSGAFAKLAGTSTWTAGKMLASGEDPAIEHKRFDDDELEALPPKLRDLVESTRALEKERPRWQDVD